MNRKPGKTIDVDRLGLFEYAFVTLKGKKEGLLTG